MCSWGSHQSCRLSSRHFPDPQRNGESWRPLTEAWQRGPCPASLREQGLREAPPLSSGRCPAGQADATGTTLGSPTNFEGDTHSLLKNERAYSSQKACCCPTSQRIAAVFKACYTAHPPPVSSSPFRSPGGLPVCEPPPRAASPPGGVVRL